MRVTPATLTIVAIAVSCALFSASAAVAAPPTWSPPVTISAADATASLPQVASDGTRITAVWTRRDGGKNRVQTSSSIDDGVTWSTPINVSDLSEDAGEPQIVTDGNTITSTWRGWIGVNHRVRTSSSSNGGVTWSIPVTISDNNPQALEQQLVRAGGTLIASWYVNDYYGTAMLHTSSSYDDGVTWSPPVIISEAGRGGGARQHQLVTDGATLTAIWSRDDGSAKRVQTTTSTNRGITWSTPVNISSLGENGQLPQIVTDGTTITATWQGLDGGFYRARTSSSTDGGATWSPPVSVSAGGNHAVNAQLATNGTSITIIWYRYNGTDGQAQTSSSVDRGVTWSAPMTLSDAGGNAYEPHLFTDGATMVAIWHHHDGSTFRAQASLSTDGGATWSATEYVSSAGVGESYERVGGAGGTITVVWNSSVGSEYQVQTSSHKGTKPTPKPTSAVTPAPTSAVVPAAVPTLEPQLAATGVSANVGGPMIAGGLLLSGFVAVLLGVRNRRAVTRS